MLRITRVMVTGIILSCFLIVSTLLTWRRSYSSYEVALDVFDGHKSGQQLHILFSNEPELAMREQRVELATARSGNPVELAMAHSGNPVELATAHSGNPVELAMAHSGNPVELATAHSGNPEELATTGNSPQLDTYLDAACGCGQAPFPELTSAGFEIKCSWEQHTTKYLSDLATYQKFSSVEASKKWCVRMRRQCTGVTCSGNICSARSGTMRDSPTNEVTFLLKKCDCPIRSDPRQKKEVFYGIPIVVLAHNRESDLTVTLQALAALSDVKIAHVHLSCDLPAAHKKMQAVLDSIFPSNRSTFLGWDGDSAVTKMRQALGEKESKASSTTHIMLHYYHAFEYAFETLNAEYAIFLEEDLRVAPDFLSMFRSVGEVFSADDDLWCVSAWNDIGFDAAQDDCRLMRSSWFPGLGFLLKRVVWQTLKPRWIYRDVLIGWDYWFRVQFLDLDKHCIIPEVSRTHHISKIGSSITRQSEVEFLDAMAVSTRASPCTADQICNAFGNVSYLVKQSYEERLHTLLANSTVAKADSSGIKLFTTQKVKRVIVPLDHRAWHTMPHFFGKLGLLPSTQKRALWGAETRCDYYGLIHLRNYDVFSDVFLVQRSAVASNNFYPQRFRDLDPVASVSFSERIGKISQSCDVVCREHGEKCVVGLFHRVNTCRALKRNLPCELGCSAQVGREIPCYVASRDDLSFQQCLISFSRDFNCDSSHGHTIRICPCAK